LAERKASELTKAKETRTKESAADEQEDDQRRSGGSNSEISMSCRPGRQVRRD
jgi:hypothetical protein